MSGPWRVDTLTPQQRRALLDELLASEAGSAGPPPVTPGALDAPSAVGGEPAPAFACSFGQERLWLLQQLDPASIAYNHCKAVRLRGPLDVDALRSAIDAMIDRHESLRTTFDDAGGAPVQRVSPRSASALVVHGPGGDDGERALAAALTAAQAEAARPFDLRRGPLVRAHLYRVRENDHVLALLLHHIVMDGWSMEILSKDLASLYQSFVEGRGPSLSPLSLQYVDFAAWQREAVNDQLMGPPLEYWKQKLAGAPPLLSLPTDRPRPPVQTDRGGAIAFEMPAELADRIRSLARREGASFFMVATAIFKTLLSRYSGQADIVVATPVAGRPRLEAESIVGFFANTLLLRTDLGGGPTFAELLARVKETCLGAYAHDQVPFERLVQELAPRRDPARSPLAQVMISMDNGDASDLRLPGLASTTLSIERQAAKFDLLLLLREGGRGPVDCELEYRTDLFDRTTIERMARHLLALFDAAATAPQTPIDLLPLLGEEERRLVVEAWNSTDFDFGPQSHATLHELLNEQARRTPTNIAVQFGERHLTYAQLNDRAERLAKHLSALGAGPDRLVAIFMDRSMEMVVALLSVLKSGAAYVPVDPGYPASRIAFMLEDCGAVALIKQPHLAVDTATVPGAIVSLPPGGELPVSASGDGASLETASSESLAYVIYTSGSTGRPKGVAIPHRAIVNHMLWMQRAFPLRPADRVLQKTPISFDASVWEFYAPLLCGATLVMAPPGAHQSPAELVACVEREAITTLQLVPTMLGAMLDEPAFGRCTSLRRVYCGGEALTTRMARRFHQTLPAELVNLYGPTEAAIDSVVWTCRPDDTAQPVQPIGRPIDNLRAYVLDQHRQPTPIGVPGELYLSGRGLARGYLNNPTLTSERFVPDPVVKDATTAAYRTGDLVRWRSDGVLEFLGRVDHQVKIRGHRIELGEIESVLARQSGVAECVVIARCDDNTEPRLVAYVSPQPGGTLRESVLREAVRGELPAYMVPAAIVLLEHLPTTPNGKIDRAALPAPAIGSASSVGTEPTTELQRSILAIWREVLRAATIGIDDDFFELGGHSLMAAQIVSRIRSTLRIDAPLRLIFESPTVARLATALEKVRSSPPPTLAPIRRIARGVNAPPRAPQATSKGPGGT